MKLRKGWLKRQIRLAEKDIATWPAWMRREAGIINRTKARGAK